MQIIGGKKNKRGSINNRIIGRMLIIVSLIFVIMIGGYSFIGYHDLYIRSRQSIEAYQEDVNYFLTDRGNGLFFVFEYPVLDPALVSEEDLFYYLDEEEEEIAAYYLEHQEQLKYGEFYHYQSRNYDTIFLLSPRYVWEESRRESLEDPLDYIVYCDFSYDSTKVRSNILLFVLIAVIVVVLLFLVSRYTVRMLDRKDTGMKNFFANASHELKTPLMSIRGNVDGIRNGYVETQAGCEIVEKEVDRMSDLISGILEISRLDSGAMKPDLVENDVREIIYDAASSLMPEMDKRGIELAMELPDPIFCPCDEAMFYSTFSNIISNAVRYAQSCIRITAEKPNAGQTCVRFENDGTPISGEDMQHIFDRFYTGAGGQNGIGMALAQEYMKLHHREIRVSVENNHTVFSIII